jgi:large subunit ribosomal protein L10
MAITKDKKREIVEKVSQAVKGAASAVFVNFHGLTVSDANALRKQLKSQGVDYVVAKKTLARRALESSGITGDLPEFPGEFALASGSDLIAPAREIYDFQKKLDGKVSIVGGIFDGRYMTKEEMVAIAAIPPVKTLHAMFVNLLASPLRGFAIAIDQIAAKKETSAA